MPDLAVILPAAGASSRYGKDKLNERLGSASVLEHSLRAFLDQIQVKSIIIVGRCSVPVRDSRIHCVEGGDCRAQSVWNGVRAVSSDLEWVAIHDAARPLVSQKLIAETFAAAQQYGAAAPALPVHLTIKHAGASLPSQVIRTVPRHDLFALQTPQIARREDLLEAFEKCPIPLTQVTDDLQLLELIGKPTWLVPGDDRNLKITTRLDFQLAQLLMQDSIG